MELNKDEQRENGDSWTQGIERLDRDDRGTHKCDGTLMGRVCGGEYADREEKRMGRVNEGMGI